MINVEWVSKKVKLYFATVDFKRKMKVYKPPVGMLYVFLLLLYNPRNSVYRYLVFKDFSCTPLSHDEYLHHKE